MILYSMTATFGKLENETLTLEKGLNILQAPNEWGKSTWCAFLTAMLYGIETRVHTTKTALADKERYAPWSGSPMSGRMDLNWNGKDITVERWSKGRSVFGQFRAYETATGMDIPELTAANCGQQLLGVEKSVFMRAGFLRLADLPVTEDEALRRRLNALVTTGDESGTADALAQKLRELKNRCRANRSNGLLPQLEAQRGDLEGKLRQLQELHDQSQRLREREAQLEAYGAKLQNHKAALAFEANRAYGERLLGAKNAQAIAQARCNELENASAADPEPARLEQNLAQLRLLRQHQQTLAFDAQLLQPPAAMPAVPEVFRGLSPQQAREQVKRDLEEYKTAEAGSENKLLLILGILLTAIGIVMAVAGRGVILWSIAAAAAMAGIVCILLRSQARGKAKAAMGAILTKYAPIAPEKWESEADYWTKLQEENAQAQLNYREKLEELRQRREDLNGKLRLLTGGEDPTACERGWEEARERQKALLDACRELQRAADLVQALQESQRQVSAPAQPDTLDFDEAETARLLADCTAEQRHLKERLGHFQGLMEALGRESELRQQLAEVQERISQAEDMLAAVEIAQATLSQATSELQRRFAPRISQRAQELFGKLTGGRYDRLMLDSDLAVHAGAKEETTLRSALWRSEGTMDQLYLALRLAVAEELTPETPLVLDDALVRFDDTRLAQALEILEQVAENRQVILFTCQSREKQLQKN